MTDMTETPSYSEAQERLLQATLETIHDVGVQNATTRRIAERAGMNLQLIQYHFGGKDAMIAEAQRYIVTRFFEVVGPAIAGAPSLVEAIRGGIVATWQLAQAHPEVVQPELLLQSVRLGAAAEVVLAPEDRQTYQRVAQLLTGVMDRTGERLRVPVDRFALLVASGLSGLVLEYRASGDRKRVAAAIDTFADLLVTLVEPAQDG